MIDKIHKSTLNPYALNILEEWSTEDAKAWVDITISDGIPESIPFESAQQAAEDSFDRNITSNNFLTFNSLSNKENLKEAKDYYINFFVKKAAIYLKSIRDHQKEIEDKFNQQMNRYSLLGHAAGARWFVMMEDSSAIKGITLDEIRVIAKDVCECKYSNKIDSRLAHVFSCFFVKEAQMLLASLEEEKKVKDDIQA